MFRPTFVRFRAPGLGVSHSRPSTRVCGAKAKNIQMADVDFNAKPDQGWEQYEPSIEWRVVDGNPQYRYRKPDNQGYDYYYSASSVEIPVDLWIAQCRAQRTFGEVGDTLSVFMAPFRFVAWLARGNCLGKLVRIFFGTVLILASVLCGWRLGVNYVHFQDHLPLDRFWWLWLVGFCVTALFGLKSFDFSEPHNK